LTGIFFVKEIYISSMIILNTNLVKLKTLKNSKIKELMKIIRRSFFSLYLPLSLQKAVRVMIYNKNTVRHLLYFSFGNFHSSLKPK